MKSCSLPFLFLCIVFSAQANCTNAYSSASYALAHAKKSLSSNNFDHQRYYAERALTAFEKTEALAANCGCDASSEPIYQGQDNLKKAIDPKDWEMGRYYTKKALANAQDLMAALDRCTSGEDTIIEEPALPDVTAASEELKNPEEMEAQLALKRLAELTLYEFEKSLKELAAILGCNQAIDLRKDFTEHTEEELTRESLESTQQFYRERTLMIQNRALKAISNCGGSQSAEAAYKEP